MTITEESLRQLARLSGVVLAQTSLESTHQEITRIALRAVPQAEGATITTFRDGRPQASAASDDWARRLDEMQHVEHEGPCLDAARTGNTFRIGDLRGEVRWPAYVARALAVGALSVLSVPLSAEGRLIGALNLYSRRADAFDADAAAIADIIAGHTGLASQVAVAYFGHRDLAEQLRAAMDSRAVIEQAKGIVMGARGLSAEDAFDALRTASQHRNVRLRDVAREVVDARSADPLG